MDKRILDFHIANLEYFIGSSIDEVSLKHWNQKADYGLEGPNMYGKYCIACLFFCVCLFLDRIDRQKSLERLNESAKFDTLVKFEWKLPKGHYD